MHRLISFLEFCDLARKLSLCTWMIGCTVLHTLSLGRAGSVFAGFSMDAFYSY